MFLCYILGTFLHMILDIICMWLCERHYARKCGYDCDKCKNWHCQYHECQRKRNKKG